MYDGEVMDSLSIPPDRRGGEGVKLFSRYIISER